MSDKAKSDQQTVLDGGMTAYERWELPSLGPVDEAANEVEIEPVTQEEVDSIRADAYEQGHKQGLDKGFKEGSEKGHKEGHKKGLEAGKQEGLQQGIDQGKKKGLKQGQAEIQKQVNDLSAIMAGMQPMLEKQESDVKEALLNVVTAVSRAVIHRELQLDRSQLSDLLDRGLAILDGTKETIEVTVNPTDLLLVENAAEEVGADWKIHTDDSLTPGGVQLKSGPSIVDLSAEKSFQQSVMNLLGRTDWAMDLASGNASQEQQLLTSLSEGFEAPQAYDEIDANDNKAAPSPDVDSDTTEASLQQDEIAETDQAVEEDLPLDPVIESDEAVSEASASEIEESELVSETEAIPEALVSESEAEVVESQANQETEQAQAQADAIDNIDDVEAVAEPEAVTETPTQAMADAQETVEPERAAPVEESQSVEEFETSDESLENTPDTAPVIETETSMIEASSDQDIIDFDAAEQDENTTVYEQAPTVSDLAEQHGMSEEDLSHQPSETLLNEEPPLLDEDAADSAAQNPQAIQQSAEQTQSNVNPKPEVQSMMQASPQNAGFEAFGWQQTAQPQAQMQQAQMQANNVSMQAQQAQAQAQQAQAQAQQAQAHAQAMTQQAQAQASQAQMMSQQAQMAQAQAGMIHPQPGMMPQPPMQQPLQTSMQQPMQAPMQPQMHGGMVPAGTMASQQGYPQQPYANNMNQGWVQAQPVPMLPVQNQPGFSVYSYHGSGMNNMAGGQPTTNAGFVPSNYQNL